MGFCAGEGVEGYFAHCNCVEGGGMSGEIQGQTVVVGAGGFDLDGGKLANVQGEITICWVGVAGVTSRTNIK